MPEKKDIFSDPKFLKGCSYAKELCNVNDSLNSLGESIDSYVAQTIRDIDALDKSMKRLEKSVDNIIPKTKQLLMAQRVGLIVDDKWKGIPKEELKKYT